MGIVFLVASIRIAASEGPVCGQCVGDVVAPCVSDDLTCSYALPDGSCPPSSSLCECPKCTESFGPCNYGNGTCTSFTNDMFVCPQLSFECDGANSSFFQSKPVNTSNVNFNSSVPKAVVDLKVVLTVTAGLLLGAILLLLAVHAYTACRNKRVQPEVRISSTPSAVAPGEKRCVAS